LKTNYLVILGFALFGAFLLTISSSAELQSFDTTVAGVPPLIPSSEQRIASMEINRSAGNMTGDDYLVALVFAYINDTLKQGQEIIVWKDGIPTKLAYINDTIKTGQERTSTESSNLLNELETKFPEYSGIYEIMHTGLEVMMEDSATNYSSGNRCTLTFVMPLQGCIDKEIDNIFGSAAGIGHIGDAYIKGHCAAVYSRLKEEAQQQSMQRAEEAKRQTARQEKMYNQLALDAHYKNFSENYTTNITSLLNQSKLGDALNLSNEAIKNLVSPYRNIMMISRGDIYTGKGRFEDAIETYQNAQNKFSYDNDSTDYQNKIQQEFMQEWNTIVIYKINLAKQKLNDQIIAKKHDLRNAPNVMQLLSGHDGGRKYSVNVENDTYASIGYVVHVNLSAINKPIDPTNKTDAYLKASDDTKAFVPICIDMFGALFADKKVAYACIQNNETYLDRFGHKNEIAVLRACISNKTATKIGNWNDFKQYIGTDINKLSSVASVRVVGEE
jgi:tetratricopeptide (TPR) repeat protein